jgi:hypothetical protein
MKKLIPFTLERWKQGNCTPKTADGREVKDLVYQPSTECYPLCGIIASKRYSWESDGIYIHNPCSPSNLMLEVDCEVVYVSLFRSSENRYYGAASIKEGAYNPNPDFIKEIKVEL